MAHELYIRTNQKLYFASLTLEQWKQAEQAQVIDAQARVQAAREATLFHLYGALLGLCHEIAGYYRLANAAGPRVEMMLSAEALVAEPTPELAELFELANQPQTWLAQLLSGYGALFEPEKTPRKAKVDPGLALIQAVSLEDETPLLRHETLESWRQSLKSLALRFRESLTEY